VNYLKERNLLGNNNNIKTSIKKKIQFATAIKRRMITSINEENIFEKCLEDIFIIYK